MWDTPPRAAFMRLLLFEQRSQRNASDERKADACPNRETCVVLSLHAATRLALSLSLQTGLGSSTLLHLDAALELSSKMRLTDYYGGNTEGETLRPVKNNASYCPQHKCTTPFPWPPQIPTAGRLFAHLSLPFSPLDISLFLRSRATSSRPPLHDSAHVRHVPHSAPLDEPSADL